MSEQPDVRDWVARIAEQDWGPALPPHYPTCLGCGPDAPHGFHVQAVRDGDRAVLASHVFTPEQSGAPGIAHGGAVATVVDDVLGFLLYLVERPGVTRRLEVDYLKPVLVGVRYDIRARVDRQEGRKVFVSCSCTGPDGVEAFRASGLFITVDLEHFSAALQGAAGDGPVAP